jgi:hypothetical protein
MSIISAALRAAKDDGLGVTVRAAGDTHTGYIVGLDEYGIDMTDPDWPNGEHTIGISLDYIDEVSV